MNSTFKRVEKKYLLTKEQAKELFSLLGERAVLDAYGLHTVCNIYYDTESHELIRRSIDKPVYKEKLRLRSYGVPTEDSIVFLELKKKWKGTVYKRRIEMPLHTAKAYLEQGVYPGEYDCQILQEIDYALHFYPLQPSLFLAYDRQAYFLAEQEDVRFTVDRRIRSREDALDLLAGDEGELFFDEDIRVLELKAPVALPKWFVSLLSELQIYPNSFSKYGSIYKEKNRQIHTYLNGMEEILPFCNSVSMEKESEIIL